MLRSHRFIFINAFLANLVLKYNNNTVVWKAMQCWIKQSRGLFKIMMGNNGKICDRLLLSKCLCSVEMFIFYSTDHISTHMYAIRYGMWYNNHLIQFNLNTKRLHGVSMNFARYLVLYGCADVSLYSVDEYRAPWKGQTHKYQNATKSMLVYINGIKLWFLSIVYEKYSLLNRIWLRLNFILLVNSSVR